jgi:hypothetical protein
MNHFPALAKIHFADLYEVAKAEVDLFAQQANVLDGTCRVQKVDADVDPEILLERRGCTLANMPAARFNEIRESLQSIQDQMRREAQAREDEAAQAELARANQIVRECSQKLRALQETKMQSSGCRSARAEEQALASYCADSRDLKMLNAELERMRRVDVASGTVDLHRRRNIVETRLFLEDRAGRAKKTLVAAGKSPGDCKPEGEVRAKQRVTQSCVVSHPIEALPECASVCWPSPCPEFFQGTLAEEGGRGEASAHLLSSPTGIARRLQRIRAVAGTDVLAGASALTKIGVSANGLVESVVVLQAKPRALGDAIAYDVRDWRFKPYLYRGEPVPFYFFERIEPRWASSVVACSSKAWAPFRDALRKFCAGNKKAAGCNATVGECSKNADDQILPIHVPADHDDFEYVLGGGDDGSAWVARFHWADGWTVTDVGMTGLGDGEARATASTDRGEPATAVAQGGEGAAPVPPTVPAVVGKANPANVPCGSPEWLQFSQAVQSYCAATKAWGCSMVEPAFRACNAEGGIAGIPKRNLSRRLFDYSFWAEDAGFITTFEKRDGKWRAIKIRVEGAEE